MKHKEANITFQQTLHPLVFIDSFQDIMSLMTSRHFGQFAPLAWSFLGISILSFVFLLFEDAFPAIFYSKIRYHHCKKDLPNDPL